MLSINAVKGFEYGSGFEGVKLNGSQHNDAFCQDGEEVKTKTNLSGGIQGGISNGEDIYFNVAFKPVATIMQDQESINQAGESVSVSGKVDTIRVWYHVPFLSLMPCLLWLLPIILLISKTNQL